MITNKPKKQKTLFLRYVFAFIATLVLSLPLHAEFTRCTGITSGLTKTDFTIALYKNASCTAEDTTSATVTECGSTGQYVIESLPDSNGDQYVLTLSYGGAVVCTYYWPMGGPALDVAWSSSITYSQNINVWKQGDTKPTYQLHVPTTASLTGYTCTFHMWNPDNGTEITTTGTTTKTAVTGGYTFEYAWDDDDLDANDQISVDDEYTTTAEYKAEIKCVCPGCGDGGIDDIITFPSNDTSRITVNKRYY